MNHLLDNITVMLLTDSSTMDGVLKAYLLDCGIKVMTLTSADETFYQKIIESKPDLIFIRAELDHAVGVEVCSFIKFHHKLKKTQVIILSTNVSIKEHAINHRANQFLSIPLSRDELCFAVESSFVKHPRILFVDDSRIYHHQIGSMLKTQNYEVVAAWNGKEALDLLAQQTFDLVILDIEMPEMDGISVCRAMQQGSARHTPVLLLTSFSSSNMIQDGFDAGADDYLIKPTTQDILLPRISRLINARQVSRAEQIVVISQSLDGLDCMSDTLISAGFKVHSFDSQNISIDDILAYDIDLIILASKNIDQHILDLCIELRETNKAASLPIIVYSDQNNKVDQVKYRSIGIQTLIGSPCTLAESIAQIEKVLVQDKLKKQQQSIQHYLSDAVVKRIENTHNQSQFAEDKYRTILFSDIVNFSSLCELWTSYDVVKLLNIYFDRMVEILMKYDATIDKFIGDAIFASFGRQEDGAHRAVCAANEMIMILPLLYKEIGYDLSIRVGINSGHVILGDVGSYHYRRDFTLIGDNVNIAQRLESMADIDSILVSQATYDLVRDKVIACDQQTLHLKNKAKMIEAFTIESVEPYFERY